VICDDFRELGLNEFGASVLVPKALEDAGGLVELPFHDEVTWGFREPEETSGEDQGPKELKSHGDTVRSCVHSVLGGVVDAGCQEEADGDGKLVAWKLLDGLVTSG
jgi:hypothetical protein